MSAYTKTIGLAFFLGFAAAASQYQTFGLGGATTGRAASVTADTTHAYGALYNPALLPAPAEPVFGFSTAVQKADFDDLGVVRREPERRAGGAPARFAPGNVKPDSVSLATWTVGLAYPFSLKKIWDRRAGLGITVSGPFHRLRSFTGGPPDDFYVLRYGTSDSQFKTALGAGLEIVPQHLYVGAGVAIFLSGGGNAEATLVSQNPTSQLSLEVGLNTSATLGALGRFGDESVSLVYHQEVSPTFRQKITGEIDAGGIPVATQPFFIRTTLYFEPSSLDFDWQHDFKILRASVGASYQRWSAFQPSYLYTETTDAAGVTRASSAPPIAMADTLSPRASVDVPLSGHVSFATGYQYRPTPVRDLSGGANLLDSNTHVAGLSIQFRIPGGEILPGDLTLAAFTQYHWLAARDVTKANASVTGAPGYHFSGNAYTYGLAIQARL